MSSDLTFITYKAIRDYVVDYLSQKLSPLKKLVVEAHPGRFDEAEIRRLYTRAPAILTSLMRLVEEGNDDNQTLSFVTWVLVRADNKDLLFDEALVLLSVLVPLLKGIDAEWAKGGADRVEANNLYSGQLGGINASLWAVSWTWPLRGSCALSQISDETDPEGGILLPSLLEAFAGFDSTTEVGSSSAEDHQDL